MRIQLCAILASSLLLTACGAAGNGASGITQADQAVQQTNNQMAQIRAQTLKAQTALDSAQKAMNTLTNADGSFKFSILLGGVNVSDLGTCVSSQFQPGTILFLPQDIANALKCVLDDVVTVVKTADDDIGLAQTTLQAALAALPSTGTDQAAQIQALLSQISQMQTSFKVMIHSLAGQITIAVSFLNSLPTLASGVCPIPGVSFLCGGAVYLFLQPLVTEITTFQVQLSTL